MKRGLFLVFCLCTSICYCFHMQDVYDTCASIEEVILRETEEITRTNPADHDLLAGWHMSRGESYLLQAKYAEAIDDFQKADAHLEYSLNSPFLISSACRITLGEIVAYDHLGMQLDAESALQRLEAAVNYFHCHNFSPDDPILGDSVFDAAVRSLITLAAVDPNEPQSKQWCESTVLNTVAALKGVAIHIPSPFIQAAAIALIQALERKALKCCYAGGLWSACLQPLANKLHQWNQKWRLFGIPPDPSWDSDLR